MKASKCPFCGGKAEIIDEGDSAGHSYRLECDKCPFNVDPGELGWTKNEAIKTWNAVVRMIRKARCPICQQKMLQFWRNGNIKCGNCEHVVSTTDDDTWEQSIDRFTGKSILEKCLDGFQQCHICLKLSCGDNQNDELKERHKQ